MKQLFIPTALDTASTVGAMTAGEAAFMVYDGDEPAIVDDLNGFPEIANNVPFSVVWKKTDGTIDVSDPITLDSIYRYDFAAYSTGTAQVSNITPIDPEGLIQEAGDVYALKVIKTNPATANLDMFTYEVVDTAGAFTVATLIAAFVTEINTTNLEASKRLGVIATSTSTNSVLTLTGYNWTTTANDPDNHFALACSLYLQGSTITYTTPNVPSAGTGAKIAALESECESYHSGITNKTKFPVIRPNSEVVTAGTYDLATFYIRKVSNSKNGTNGTNVENIKLYIAEDTATASGQVAYQIYHRLATNDLGTTS